MSAGRDDVAETCRRVILALAGPSGVVWPSCPGHAIGIAGIVLVVLPFRCGARLS